MKLIRKYIRCSMKKEREFELQFPQHMNHPDQAYRTRK
ncbi:MAG: hypothetical protein S4CHLAM123_07960 [Chlamydiales bacterium]|nr:hypothetical protein [Chlamydiales bacterium]